jgi:hypothetical protein
MAWGKPAPGHAPDILGGAVLMPLVESDPLGAAAGAAVGQKYG